MKQNKNIPTTIDEGLMPGTAEAVIALPFQARPLVVRGVAEAVIEATQRAADALPYAEPVVTPVAAPRPARGPENAPQAIYNEPSVRDRVRQYFADGHVRRFDRQHGSNLYGELLEKRRRDALFLKASQIGLLGQDSLFYKRKLGQLAKH